MPGILPMKVIKVGSSSQSRIAQACDRCRSKKIRCDGIRPCCSQCSNVGFECRTSDKLSRRAFPRGYTESLEERVRQLEAEVRELKDLLDEKDEKIDMLSKMHSNHRRSSVASQMPSPRAASVSSPLSSTAVAIKTDGARQSSSLSPGPVAESISGVSTVSSGLQRKTHETLNGEKSGAVSGSATVPKRESRSPTAPPAKEGTFRVQASPLLLGVENSDSYFMGASSGRSFIETFKRKMQESGKSCSDFHAEAFLHIQGCYPLVEKVPTGTMRIPPRLFSDRCVNVYFQEWSPLFPILHRPAFLRIYDEFVSDPDKVKNHHKLTQLYLVFAIAALSTDQPDLEQIAICEEQWHRSLETVLMDNTIITLQCLVLALLYCTIRADYKRLQYYKGIAVGLSHRLGLHQSQKRFSFGALTIETRKKVFWTLYTLDCFSAAVLGLPKMLKDNDIHAEYPSDTDDEYVTEKGFQPTLPGEFTRLSSALALFRATRILAKVLETNYPAAASHELSLQQMSSLDSELAEWRDTLPTHLTLTFRQEKPSTDVTGNRSPLLSLTYNYIRTLIWRPAVGTSLGAKAGPAVMAISEASKYIIQIVELLEERKMSFSICLNKPDLLVVCGMTLLYQSMDLKQDSKMLKDSERLINSVIKIADRTKAPGCYDLKRVAGMLITLDEPISPAPNSSDHGSPIVPTIQRGSSTGSRQKKIQQHPQQLGISLRTAASASESDLHYQNKLRRMTMPTTAATGGMDIKTEPQPYRSRSRSSFDNPREHQQKQHRLSMSQAQMLNRMPQQQQHQQQQRIQQKKNMDYISLGSNGGISSRSQPSSPLQSRHAQQQHQTQFFGSVPQKPSPSGVTTADWEALLSSMDGGQMNVYDAIYGGPAIALANATDATPASAPSQSGDGWSPESWDLAGFSLGDLTGPESHSSGPGSIPPPAQSVLSFSDESMSSVGEDMASTDLASLGLGGLDIGTLDYRSASGLLNSGCGSGTDGFVIDSMESGFVL